MGQRLLLICLTALCLQAAPPAFTKVGKGPGILLIHGFGGNKEVWTEVAAELARDHTVLSVDLPRPRLDEMRYTTHFGELARKLKEAIVL